MSDIPVSDPNQTSSRRTGWLSLLWLVVPLAAMAAAVWWLYAANPLAAFNNGAPPVENLTYERTILDADGLRVLVRAGGSEPMRIAQVMVDDAYWEFTQTPAGQLARGDTAWIALPFPWVLGEAHVVNIVTATGATFAHDIAVAVPSPVPTSAALNAQAVLGFFVGIVPVAIGMMFYPALRGVGRGGMDFLLSLTIGLLAFLLVDTLEDALEFAGEAALVFQGPTMVILAAIGSFLLLMAVARRNGTPTGLALATFIAIGIGLHNLGEGLAIGAAFAGGAAGLGTFLVLGFTLHNITEGIGIAAPLLKQRPPLWAFPVLVLVAGFPAVVGMWVGSLAFAPHWSALALAVGAGAILQVIVEVVALLARGGSGRLVSAPVVGGLFVGVAVMYATAALVKI
ncbi:MAG: ZIP family metal transporter [Rhizobiaceae bacterium]